MTQRWTGTSPARRPLIIGGAAVGVLLLGLLLYFSISSGDDDVGTRDADFDWLATRQSDLETVAKRLMDYAAGHNHAFPKDREALAAAGILTPEQARFRDPVRNVEVLRQYRPGTAVSKEGYRTILILENYEPNPAGDLLVVYSDGQVGMRTNLEATLADDNEQRKYLKLPEIPWSPP